MRHSAVLEHPLQDEAGSTVKAPAPGTSQLAHFAAS